MSALERFITIMAGYGSPMTYKHERKGDSDAADGQPVDVQHEPHGIVAVRGGLPATHRRNQGQYLAR